MVSKINSTAFTDFTIMDKSNHNANDSDPNQTNSSLSYTMTDAELVELREVHHQDNNNKTNSKVNGKKFKDHKNKSFLSSTENILSDKTNGKQLLHQSAVWQYAVRDDDNPNYAICSLCPNNKRISTNNGSTTTLRKHLILKHDKHNLILTNNKRKRTKVLLNPIKKHELHHMFMNCIIRDGRTFNDFEKVGIKKLLQALVPGKFIYKMNI